ncbi:MAG: hypothetical protein IK117_08445 [Bacteroidales bacterium]|nr:hypothetical protein [Bacteroidales bacterium]
MQPVQIDSMEFGVKKEYTDEEFTILKTIGNGILRIDSQNYQVLVSSDEMNNLDIFSYIYDIRYRSGNAIKTPLSGKIIIKESVFDG